MTRVMFTRELSQGSQVLRVSVMQPERIEAGRYGCAFRILGFAEPIENVIYGIDGLQSFQLAMRIVAAELDGRSGQEEPIEFLRGHHGF